MKRGVGEDVKGGLGGVEKYGRRLGEMWVEVREMWGEMWAVGKVRGDVGRSMGGVGRCGGNSKRGGGTCAGVRGSVVKGDEGERG